MISDKVWKKIPVSQIAEIVLGGTPKTKVKEYWGGDIPWASAKDISNNIDRYIHKTEKLITKKGLDNSNTRLLPKGTIVITARGTVGKLAILPRDMCFNQSCYGLISKEEIIPLFLYYALEESLNQLLSLTYGTVFDTITIKSFDDLEIYLPDKTNQEAISSILDFIDSLIELNLHMNRTLDKIAQAIYKSWFIDFEPFQEGEFIESKLGMMPKGWKVGKIEDLCDDIKNGGTPLRKEKLYWKNGKINWFKTGELEDSILLDSEEKITEIGLKNSSCHLLPINTIVIAIYAAPTVGRLGILKKPATTNQACTALIPKSNVGYIYIFHSLLANRSVLNAIASGSAQQNISQGIIRNLKVPIPPIEVTIKFQKVLECFYDYITKNIEESKILFKIKDLILPQLISGRLRITNPVEFLEEIFN